VEALTPPIEWGTATFTREGEAESGDRYSVVPYDAGALVAVIDGLGHGEEAASAAQLAAQILESGPRDSIVSLISRCHERLRSTRGVVMSLASFNALDDTMTWLGVGNVEGRLFRAGPDATALEERRTGHVPVAAERRRAEQGRRGSESLLLRAGVVGSHLPLLDGSRVSIHLGDTLVLATDGVDLPSEDDVGPGELPQSIADRILTRHKKGTDDALVVVVRWVGTPR
jgi:phosphoserine phosphatase RsbX